MLAAFMVLAGIGWIMAEAIPEPLTIYVDAGSEAGDSADGTEALPYATLSAAIDAANAAADASAVTILVAEGTYGSADAIVSMGSLTKAGTTIQPKEGTTKRPVVYGSFHLLANDCAINGLEIHIKGGDESVLTKNAIDVVAKSATIRENEFVMEANTSGTKVGNGVNIWPYGDGEVNYNITNNVFHMFNDRTEGWSSTALLVTEESSLARFGDSFSDKSSTTVVIPNEIDLWKNNTFMNCYLDYGRSNWNYSGATNAAGKAPLRQFSCVSNNPASLHTAVNYSVAGAPIYVAGEFDLSVKDEEANTHYWTIPTGIKVQGLDADNKAVFNNCNLLVKAEDVTLANLKLNQNSYGFKVWEKSAVVAVADKITIDNCDFTGGVSANTYVANGLMLYPQNTSVTYTVKNNTFTNYNFTATDKSTSTAIILRDNKQLTLPDGTTKTTDATVTYDAAAEKAIAEANTYTDCFYSYLHWTGDKYVYAQIESAEGVVDALPMAKGTKGTIVSKNTTLDAVMALVNKNTELTLPSDAIMELADAYLYTNATTAGSASTTDKLVTYITGTERPFTLMLGKTADTYYVSVEGAGKKDGSSAENALPAKFLQGAINAATADVKLAAGEYIGNFVMKAGVNVTGAVDGNGKPASILNGAAEGRVVSYKADAKYDGAAFTESGLTNATTWSNLMITNGKADDAAGAIITKNVTLKNCEISTNVTTGKAGGVMCYMGGVIDGCLIHNNEAVKGGGGVVMHYAGMIQNSEVYSNISKGEDITAHSGGISTRVKIDGINDANSKMEIINCKVYDNEAFLTGGVTLNGQTTMVNTLVYGNRTTGTVGLPDAAKNTDAVQGAVTFSVAGAQMINCTVWGNTAASDKAEPNVSVFENSNGIVKNSIMESVTTSTGVSITYSASASLETDAATTHNVKLEGNPFEEGSYELAAKIGEAVNPCINGGSNAAYIATYPKTDLAGKTRIQGLVESVATIDMGTFEFVKVTEPVNDADGLADAVKGNEPEIILSDNVELDDVELTVSATTVIKSADPNQPVSITVASDKTAFTTVEGAELTLENINIVVAEGATTTPKAINVAASSTVNLEGAHVEGATVEVSGELNLTNSGFKADAETAALDIKGTGVVVIEGAEFVGKAITATSGATFTLSGCNFVNVSTKSASGLLSEVIAAGDANATIDRCKFVGIVGEGAIISGKKVTVSNCLFYNNGNMKLMDIAESSTVSIINNTFVNATDADNAEPVITIAATQTNVNIKNNILWTVADEAIENSASSNVVISHNALKTAATVETNSLKLATFDYIKFDNTNYKYQLHKDSPVAKAQGDITGITEDAMDILGDARLTDDGTNKTVHLGAYESVYTPTTGGGSTGGGTGDTTPDATGIKLDKTTLTLARLQSYTLVATVEPAAAGGVKWTSTDPSIATVDANGKVTAVKVGQATIIATAINGGLTALCQVTVDFATGVEEALAESAIFGREGGIQIQPATPVEMIIVNMAGTVVAHRTISQAETISVPKGIYIVRLSSGGHVLTQKVNVR
ncbi:T9SS C-terminal target domain-containing protein [Parabacteroides acidifaciens]|nr:T9SS C-terminal target domain-containing protein [Parabacteroides acidifaciens]